MTYYSNYYYYSVKYYPIRNELNNLNDWSVKKTRKIIYIKSDSFSKNKLLIIWVDCFEVLATPVDTILVIVKVRWN